MALLDHFHPPLKDDPQWDGVANMWACRIVAQLNRERLPQEYVALPSLRYGGRGRLEADPAATAPTPPTLNLAVNCVDMDAVEVQVFHEEGGLRLVAVVKLVTHRNKDRSAAREAFAIKCASYLQQGISLVVVDVVTVWKANLHRQLLQLLRLSERAGNREFPDLYAVAYRAFTAAGEGQLQVWEESLALGRNLPTMPLWIDIDKCLPVDLEASYREACADLRIAT